MKRSRLHLVHNIQSGAFVRGMRLEDLRQSIETAGWNIVGETDLAADMSNGLDTLASVDADAIAIAGGDGTLISVLGTMVRQKVEAPALILPCGTANLLARQVHASLDMTELLTAARSAPTESLPLGDANGHLFAVVAAIGISPGLARAREHIRGTESSNRTLRFWTYVLAGMRSFFRGKFYVDLMCDEAPRQTTAVYVMCPEAMNAEKTFTVFGGRMRNVADLAAGVAKTAIPLPDNRSSWTASTAQMIILSKTKLPVILDGEPTRLETPIRVEFCKHSINVITT